MVLAWPNQGPHAREVGAARLLRMTASPPEKWQRVRTPPFTTATNDAGCTATRCQFSPRHLVFEESGVRSRRGRPLPSPASSLASDDAPSRTPVAGRSSPLK
ncbi:hypothetical protein GCM10022229_04830 [Luteimonas lutimaris]|uniref:Uncharacterized protein n=1 Tax=Luteimonas lutimaris TaxID=698645 RepID=A0ABP7M5K5_9GAMM